jgi:hypothetical protein
VARIRSIHPGLFTDEGYMCLSLAAKATWPGIWTEADDHGVFEWKPITLKAKLMPADNVDMIALLAEFVAQGLAVQFTHEGKSYGVIKGFLRWQRPREPSYRYPFPKEAELTARNDGIPDAALPQDDATPPEKSPQREEGGDQREEEKKEEERGKRATQMPDGWHEDDELIAYARAQGCRDPADTFERFRLHHGGKGSKFKDWRMAAQLWCRNEKSFGGQSRAPDQPPSRPKFN